MDIPLEVSYRYVDKTEEIENLINERVQDLEKVADHLISCRIAVEKPNSLPETGDIYRIRIIMRIPPGHELVVTKDPGDRQKFEPLTVLIKDAFDAAERKIRDFTEKRRNY